MKLHVYFNPLSFQEYVSEEYVCGDTYFYIRYLSEEKTSETISIPREKIYAVWRVYEDGKKLVHLRKSPRKKQYK